MPLPSTLTTAGALLSSAALGLAGLTSGDAEQAPSPVTQPAVAEQADETTVVAHRGASAYAPENTLAATDAAADLGIDWVEVDLQRTADGELILLHDTDLERTTDVAEVFPDRAPWALEDFTYDEIAQLDAGSWFGDEFAGEPVPTFGQLLDRLDERDQKLLLELKDPDLYPGIEEEALAELAEHGWTTPERLAEDLVVQSFDEASVRAVHEANPEITTGFLGTPEVSELAEYATFADQVNPPHADVTADYVAAAREHTGPGGAPLQVLTWTVNDPEDARRVADAGVDGIISDVPDVVRDVIGG